MTKHWAVKIDYMRKSDPNEVDKSVVYEATQEDGLLVAEVCRGVRFSQFIIDFKSKLSWKYSSSLRHFALKVRHLAGLFWHFE